MNDIDCPLCFSKMEIQSVSFPSHEQCNFVQEFSQGSKVYNHKEESDIEMRCIKCNAKLFFKTKTSSVSISYSERDAIIVVKGNYNAGKSSDDIRKTDVDYFKEKLKEEV